jgi:hypothetical protein
VYKYTEPKQEYILRTTIHDRYTSKTQVSTTTQNEEYVYSERLIISLYTIPKYSTISKVYKQRATYEIIKKKTISPSTIPKSTTIPTTAYSCIDPIILQSTTHISITILETESILPETTTTTEYSTMYLVITMHEMEYYHTVEITHNMVQQ